MLKSFIKKHEPAVAPGKPSEESWLEIVQDRVRSIPFGEVQIVIQDSKVVQIDATEKKRFDRNGPH